MLMAGTRPTIGWYRRHQIAKSLQSDSRGSDGRPRASLSVSNTRSRSSADRPRRA